MPLSAKSTESRSRVRGSLSVGSDDDQSQTAAEQSLLGASLTCSTADSTVRHALALFGSLPHTWRNLYMVLDPVLADVRGEENLKDKNWVHSKAIERFKWTANNFRVLGSEARHGTLNDPPDKPMTLTEAKAMLVSILRGWIADKCP